MINVIVIRKLGGLGLANASTAALPAYLPVDGHDVATLVATLRKEAVS